MASTRISDLGALADGRRVEGVEITGDGLRVRLSAFGAALVGLGVETPGGVRDVVLGFADAATAERHAGHHVGAVAGRVANRIAGARYRLDGREHRTEANEGPNTLHDGAAGFGRRLWRIATTGPREAVFEIVSPDGDGGHPGRLVARAAYRITGPRTLTLELTAETDRPTVVNLAPHAYFDLSGSKGVARAARAHRLRLAADRYLPVDAATLPTGEIAAVAGTAYDFRAGRRLDAVPAPYDHCFVVADARRAAPVEVARLVAPDGALGLVMSATEPGLQLYDGRFLDAPPLAPHGGLCLEPQAFPDAPNRPAFPSARLDPGAVRRSTTIYTFDDGD